MSQNWAVKVENASMHFNLANEKVDNLKEYVIKLARRQLFYRDFVAVCNVSLEIRKGEVFGIVGTNGSGKSTLLKMISGIIKPTTGTIEVKGNIAPLIELGAGFDGDLTARENIYLNGAVLGYSKAFIDNHFDVIVEFAELRDFLDVPIKNYSSGMVARIAFAIATIIEPDILIVDEILSVGDFLFQQKCEKRIRELMDKGITVIIVSHSIDQIAKLCDRVMWIEKSQVKMIGGTFDVCNAYRNLQNVVQHAKVQDLCIVAQEVCSLCSKDAEFRVEQGVVLFREAVCSFCGSSIRNADVARTLLEQIGSKKKSLQEALPEFSELSILNCASSGVIHNIMKGLPNYVNYERDESILCGGKSQIPFANNSFDIVISEDLLSHANDVSSILTEIKRVLSKNGTHIFTVPFHEGRDTVFRKKLENKVYRGDPVRGDGTLVTVDWGQDIIKIIDQYGFSTKILKLHHFHNADEITNVDETFEECKNIHPFYYYRYNSVVFVSQISH